MRNLERCGAGTLGVTEDVQLGDGQRGDEVVGFFKTFVGFSARADNHVHADEGIGHDAANEFHLIAEKRRVVAALHERKHGVAAALKGNVEVGHEGAAVGAEINNLVGEQIRLNARDAVALDAFNLVKCVDELREVLAGGAAEIADVHAGEHNFKSAVGRGLFGLRHHFGNGGVARSTTCGRDGAVGAIIVAAVLHLEEVAGAIAAGAGGDEGLDVAERSGVADAAVRLTVGTHAELFGLVVLFDEFDEAAFLFLPHHEVHPLDLCDVLARELRVAAHHGDERIGVFAVQAADGMTTLGVGFAGDAAGVDDTDIGSFVVGRCATFRAEAIAQSRGFGIVEFAPQRDEGGLLLIYRR